MQIGELFVRLTADPSGVKKGTAEAARSFVDFEGAIKRVGGALAAAFTVREIARFGVESVRAFAEAEAVWVRLGSAVDAAGGSFDAMRPQIEGAAKQIETLTRFSDEDFAGALQGLVIQTGDVQKSLGIMGLAADLAAAKGIGLSDATEVLGKALAGNTTQLTRMFPALKGSKDLFGQLREMVKGMSEKEGATLEGRLAQLDGAWGNFKEAIGGAIAGTVGLQGAAVALTGKLNTLTTFIEDNRDALNGLTAPFRIAAGSFAFFASGVGKAIDAYQKYIDFVNKARGVVPDIERERMGGHAAGPEQLPEMTFSVSSIDPQKIAKAYQDLATDLRVATQMSQLLGDTQGELREKLTATTSTLTDLLRLGVSPTTAGVRELVGQIQTMTLLLEEVGTREFAVKLKGITSFDLQRTTKDPAPGGPGSATANARSGVEQALSNVMGQLSGAFQSLMASLGPMAIVGEFLNGVFAALAPVLDALMVPIRNIGFLLGATLAPVLKLLQPILNGVAKVFAFVIQAIGEFIKGLGSAINFLLPGNPANGLVSFGQNMIDMAKQSRAAIDAGTDLTKTVNGMNESLRNVPVGFNVPAARNDAVRQVEFGEASGGRGVSIGTMNVHASDPEELGRKLRQRARRGGSFPLEPAYE